MALKTKYIGDFLGYTLLKNMGVHRTSDLVGFRSAGKFWQFGYGGKMVKIWKIWQILAIQGKTDQKYRAFNILVEK